MASLSTLGPLPTTFALPSQCAQTLGDVYKVFTTGTPNNYLLQGPAGGLPTSCLPSGYNGSPNQVYSPGTQCPTGFTSACDSTSTRGSVTETVLRCCPTNAKFTCRTKNDFAWQSTLGCYQAEDTRATTTWTVHQVSGTVTSAALVTSTGNAGGLNAYQIQVAFQSTDTSSKDKTKTKTVTKTTDKSKPTSNSSSSSSSKGKKKKNKGIGSGGIAGIVVGIVVAVLAAIVGFILKARKKNDGEQIPGEDHDNDAEKNVGGGGAGGAAGTTTGGRDSSSSSDDIDNRREARGLGTTDTTANAPPTTSFSDGPYRDVDTSYRGGDAEAGFTRGNPDGTHIR